MKEQENNKDNINPNINNNDIENMKKNEFCRPGCGRGFTIKKEVLIKLFESK